MHAHGTRVAVAMVSGVALAGAIAGCSTSAASMSPAALKQLQAVQAAHKAAEQAAPVPSVDPTTVSDSTSAPADSSRATPGPTATPKSTSTPVTHTSTPKPSSTPSATPTPSPSPSVAAVYADGSYSATGSYQSPGGWEKLRVTLTLTDDIIKSLTVESVHVDPTAANYEAQFESGINAIVVGKDIDEVNVGAVAGSSLTALGFNSALGKIKSQAQL